VTVTNTTRRARPLAPDDRRAAILDAAVPLFIASGSGVTTRQIADAAGIAEGTIFRVFDGKDAIVDAVVARFMDPAPTLERLAAIDESLDLEGTIAAMVEILGERIKGVMGIMQAVGMRKPPAHPPRAEGDEANSVALEVLGRHKHELGVPPEAAIAIIRAAVFGSSIVPFAGAHPLDPGDLAHIIVYGIGKA
jgi:AcrR family transcriptional regulator